jgi:hypothetical protein
MLPTKDQERLKFDSKVKKKTRSIPLKVAAETVGMIGFTALPLALLHPAFLVAMPLALFARWRLLIKAARIYGPHLGEDHGRARKATDNDLSGARLF